MIEPIEPDKTSETSAFKFENIHIASHGEKMPLEITDDPTVLRTILQEMINVLRGPDGKPASRERALAVTKLQEARYWIGEDMFKN